MPRFKRKVMSEAVVYANKTSDEEAALRYRVKTPTIQVWRGLFLKETPKSPLMLLPPKKIMEKELSQWVLNRLQGGRRPTLAEISWKGLAIARRVGANEFAPTTSRGFMFMKKVKLLKRWQSCLRDERNQRAAKKLEESLKVKNYVKKSVKRRSKISVQDSFGHSNEQLVDWLNEKLERGDRPTLKQISTKGLEIRRHFGGPEFIPHPHWGQQFILKHGLLEKWRLCLKKERETTDNLTWRPSDPNEIKMEFSDVMETIPHQDFQVLETNINEINLKYETLRKDFVQLKQEHDTLLDFHKQQEESVDEQGRLMIADGRHESLMDKAIQYAELHGNQEAITKFNVTAESFYEYLVGGSVNEPECDPEIASSSPSVHEGDLNQDLDRQQTLDVANEEIPLIDNEFSDQDVDTVKISQIKSKAPVEQMPTDPSTDNSLLPYSESSISQASPTEVNEENLRNHAERALVSWTSHQTRLLSSENNDKNPTVWGNSADQTDNNHAYSANIADHHHQAKQAKTMDLDPNPFVESGLVRRSGSFTEKELTELLEEAEYHKSMFHLCKAMYENRKLPSEIPKKPRFVASKMLHKILRDQSYADKALQVHQLLYQTLDKNIENKFDIQREGEDVVSELLRLFDGTKKQNPLPYYAAIGGILHQAQDDDVLHHTISPVLRWSDAYMQTIIKIHSICERYPIFKCLHINMSAFISSMRCITHIMARDECRQAWVEASIQRGLSFPT